MKKFIAQTCLFAGIISTIFMGSDFVNSMSFWNGIPKTKMPYAYFQKIRFYAPISGFEPTMYSLSRNKIYNEETGLVVDIDEFSYTGVIKASATNPFAPPPRRPPAKKK